MQENVIEKKSFSFAVRIVKLYRFMTKHEKEYVLSKQLLRCGTSIGANVSEAQRAQSMADFHAKMSIALKEANETLYWIELLFQTEYLSDRQYDSLKKDVLELLRILMSICKSSNGEY